jgi:hypothetical protein
MKRKALLLITLCILLCRCEMKADVAKYRYTQDMDNNGLLNSVFYFIPATSNDIEENFTWLPDNNAMGVYWDNHIQIKLSDEEKSEIKASLDEFVSTYYKLSSVFSDYNHAIELPVLSEELRCTISESEYFPCLFDEIQKCRVECDIPLLLIYDYVISNVNSDVERYIVPVKLQVEFYDDGTDAFSAKYNSYVRGNGNFIDLWCAFERSSESFILDAWTEVFQDPYSVKIYSCSGIEEVYHAFYATWEICRYIEDLYKYLQPTENMALISEGKYINYTEKLLQTIFSFNSKTNINRYQKELINLLNDEKAVNSWVQQLIEYNATLVSAGYLDAVAQYNGSYTEGKNIYHDFSIDAQIACAINSISSQYMQFGENVIVEGTFQCVFHVLLFEDQNGNIQCYDWCIDNLKRHTNPSFK